MSWVLFRTLVAWLTPRYVTRYYSDKPLEEKARIFQLLIQPTIDMLSSYGRFFESESALFEVLGWNWIVGERSASEEEIKERDNFRKMVSLTGTFLGRAGL